MLRWNKFVLMSLGIGLLTTNVKAEIDVKRLQVNGYDVVLVNTHAGNAVAFTANVPVGSWHDDPVKHAGRAHLFEHVIHGGSKKYPGHQTFFSLIPAVGGTYNAYTADGRTFYHWIGHPDGLEEAADLIGAMLVAPEFSEKTFRMELSTVKNEAAEYQAQDAYVLQGGVMTGLLADGHPLKMYDVGTQAQLDGMSLNDLKQLYFANYTPKAMTIIVAGNFDALEDGKPPITEERVIAAIKANFTPPNPESDPDVAKLSLIPGGQKKFPSLRASADAPQFVEFGTPQENYDLKIVFEQDGDVPLGVRESLNDYLNLPVEGSLGKELERRGWVTSFGVSPQSVNNLQINNAYFSLTPEGTKHRDEVVAAFFTALHELRTKGVRDNVLALLRQRNVEGYPHSMTNPKKIAEHIARVGEFGVPPEKAFDFAGTYGSVTSSDLQMAVAKCYPIDRMLVGYIGHDVKSSETDPVFSRPFVVSHRHETLAAWKKALNQGGGFGAVGTTLVVPKYDFPHRHTPIARPNAVPRIVESGSPGVVAALEEKHAMPKGAAAIQLVLSEGTRQSRIATSLFNWALHDRLEPAYDFLASIGLRASVGAGGGKLSVQVQGNSAAVPAMTGWVLDELSKFEPTQEELALVAERFRNNLRESEDGFTAMVAHLGAKTFLSSRDGMTTGELKEAFASLDLAQVATLARERLKNTAVTVALSGDFDEKSVQAVVQEVTTRFPGRLDPAEAKRLLRGMPAPKQTLAYWQTIAPTKEDDQFGWARAFPGPKPMSREAAAVSVLVHFLNKQVFQLNRIQKELGYVHAMSVEFTPEAVRPIFYGQTTGLERLPLIETGWADLLKKVADGTLSPDDFAGSRRAIVRTQGVLPFTPGEEAARVLSDLETTGNPHASEGWKKFFHEITASEVYAAGRTYLVGTPTVDAVAGKQPPKGLSCGELIADPAKMRAQVLSQ